MSKTSEISQNFLPDTLTLLKWGEVFGVYKYASMFGASIGGLTKRERPPADEVRRVYNFKKYGKHKEEFEVIVKAAARHFDCAEVVAVPGHSPKPNELQKLFGEKIRRTDEVQPMKYFRKAGMDKNYSKSFTIQGVGTGRVLLVDDICTTGKTLEFFADQLKKRGCDVVKFVLALDYKLEVEQAGAIDLRLGDAAGMPTATISDFEKTTVSVSGLARLFDCDRKKVRDTLDDAGVEPVGEGKEKLYLLSDAVRAFLRANEIELAKLRKIELEGDRLEMRRDREKGELVPVREVQTTLIEILAALFKRVCTDYPKSAARKLAKADTPKAVSDAITRDLTGVFNDLRTDFKAFLGSPAESDS